MDKLLERGILKAGEVGDIIVERDEEEAPAAPTAVPAQPERRAQKQK